MTRPRVAIAHDYLTQRGGAERVVLAMARAFPEATIHTTLFDPAGTYPELAERRIVTSLLDRVPALRADHRRALPLLAPVSSRTVVDADVVIASSSGWAHGFRATGRKLVYCHAPARWLYQSESYLGGSLTSSARGWALLPLRAGLRRWDARAAATADRYLANSTVVRERIRQAYGIEAGLLHPPHGVSREGEQRAVPAAQEWVTPGLGYHLVVSRLLPYKNVDVVIEAFRGLPQERLLVIGDGPLREQLTATAPSNVRLVHGLDDGQMRWAYAHARALIAPSLEDFGLTPIEAASFGVPTLALRAGGYLDTVVEDRTGRFVGSASVEQILWGVKDMSRRSWDLASIQEHAETFAEGRFAAALRREVDHLASR